MAVPARSPVDLAAYQQRVITRCFVCAMVAEDPEYRHELVYADDAHIAFLSRYPTLVGYLIVAPKAHIEHVVRDLAEADFLRLMGVVRRVALAVGAVTQPERTYLLSLGSQSGNAHLHWHIAPLPSGVPYPQQQFHALMMENGVVDLSPSQMAELAARIRAALAA